MCYHNSYGYTVHIGYSRSHGLRVNRHVIFILSLAATKLSDYFLVASRAKYKCPISLFAAVSVGVLPPMPQHRRAMSGIPNVSIDPPALDSRSRSAASSAGTARAGTLKSVKSAIATRTKARTRSRLCRITRPTYRRASGWLRTPPRGPLWRSRAITASSEPVRSSLTSM